MSPCFVLEGGAKEKWPSSVFANLGIPAVGFWLLIQFDLSYRCWLFDLLVIMWLGCPTYIRYCIVSVSTSILAIPGGQIPVLYQYVMPTKFLQGIPLLLQQLEIFGNWIITAESFLLGLSFCLMLQARTFCKGSSGFALEGFGGLKAMSLHLNHLNHSTWMELYPMWCTFTYTSLPLQSGFCRAG